MTCPPPPLLLKAVEAEPERLLARTILLLLHPLPDNSKILRIRE